MQARLLEAGAALLLKRVVDLGVAQAAEARRRASAPLLRCGSSRLRRGRDRHPNFRFRTANFVRRMSATGRSATNSRPNSMAESRRSVVTSRLRHVEELPHKTRPPAYPVLVSFSPSSDSSRPEVTEPHPTRKRTRSEPEVIPMSPEMDVGGRLQRLTIARAPEAPPPLDSKSAILSHCPVEQLNVRRVRTAPPAGGQLQW